MQTNSNKKIRVHIWIKGRVQAVGFRSHIEFNALQIGVLGWVRNLERHTLETVAEGTQAQIDKFIEMVKQGPRACCVDEARVEYEEPTGQLEGFSVKRSL